LRQVSTQITPFRYPTAFAAVQHELKGHTHVIAQLHGRTSQKPIPPLSPNFSFPLILKTIRVCCATTLPIAFLVTRAVVMHLQSTKAQMTALRATAAYPLIDDASSWPVVEWKEDDDTEVLAIFHIDEDVEEPESCSWVTHTGVGPCKDDDKTQRRWRKSSIAWNVGHLGHLKTLFGAAQHILDLLEWSVADAFVLYCQSDPEDCSTEE
jgi:hypothetical protein